MKLETEVAISRPIGEVFEYWADLERASEWAAPVIARRKLTDGPVAVGTRFHAVDQFPGRRLEFDLEITEFEPNRLMAAKWFKPMEGGWEARFSEADGRTQLSMRAEMSPVGLMKLLSPLMGPWAKRQMQRDLQAFKDLLESTSRSEQ